MNKVDPMTEMLRLFAETGGITYKTCSGVEFARHRLFSKFVSRDTGLIGLLRYFSIAQFTKSRPVDYIGPFQLRIPRINYLLWLTANDSQRYYMHEDKYGFESPRHSGSTDEGVTPRLLQMSVPGVYQD